MFTYNWAVTHQRIFNFLLFGPRWQFVQNLRLNMHTETHIQNIKHKQLVSVIGHTQHFPTSFKAP